MTTPLFTFSAAPRVVACPASATLPQSPGPESSYSSRGSAIHEFLYNVQLHGRVEALAYAPPEMRSALSAIDLSRLPAGMTGYASERAFAYSPQTDMARVLGDNLQRKYDTREGEIPGAVDVLALEGDDGVFVLDYKTGRGRVVAAAENWQLRIGALAAARAYRRSRATVAICFLHEDGEAFFDTAQFDSFDLDGFSGELRSVCRLIATRAVPDPREGDHCRYCPAFKHCPAKIGLVQALARSADTDPDRMAAWIRDGLTAESAAEAWRRLKIIEGVTKRARELLYGFAAKEPIALGDGYMLGERASSVMKIVDADKAAQAAESLLEIEIPEAFFDVRTTLTRIGETLKPVVAAKGGRWSEFEEKLRKRMLENGAAEIEERRGVKEYKG